MIKDSVFYRIQCFFCQGKKCKSELWSNTKRGENLKIGVVGLNSHFVTDQIIASCRLTNKAIEDYSLYSSFKEQNILGVFNLEEKFEHGFCGDFDRNVFEKTGFSYDPEELRNNGIQYFSFPLPDMCSPKSFEYVLNIVIAMESVISSKEKNEEGRKEIKPKVLVHCHSGLGRTGLVIACWMIWKRKEDSIESIIKIIRSKRPGSIQTESQIKFLGKFKKWLKKQLTESLLSPLKNITALNGVDVKMDFRKQILNFYYNESVIQ